MAKLSLLAGSTNKLVSVFLQDSSVTTGAGITGLTSASAGLTAYYYREGAGSAVAITLVTMTLGTWTSGGFIVVDGTNLPGVYSIGLPNAALAAGAKSVLLMIKGATNLAPCLLEIELTATDNQDAVRMGLTALPNAAAQAAGGLYTRGTGAGQINQSANGQIDANAVTVSGTAQTARDLGASVLLSAGTGTGQILLTSGAVTVGTLSDKAGYSLSALESPILESGTAQAGGASTITLRAGASATNNLHRGLMLRVYGGTGAGQARVITGYVGSTKIATVDTPWITNPDATSTYAIIGLEAPGLDTTGSVKIQIPLKRNTALPNFPFEMRDTSGNLASGLTITAQVSIDGAALVAATNAVRAHPSGGGSYLLDLAAADLNGISIRLRFTAAGATVKDIELFTQP